MLVLNKNILTIGGNRLEGGPLTPPTPPGPTPIILPDNTIRVKYSPGTSPSNVYGRKTKVSDEDNIWDVYVPENDYWESEFNGETDLIEVLAGNLIWVTTLKKAFGSCTSLTKVSQLNTQRLLTTNYMFKNCSALTNVSLFDTSTVTDMSSMFDGCSSLINVPLFNTSSATNVNYAFYGTNNVESGALALYQQMSTQTNITSHRSTFRNCGNNTTTGAAELSQIPSGWK